jgi:hypothetical protein
LALHTSEVVSQAKKRGDVVFHQAECLVAARTQDTPNIASFVIMVYRPHSTAFWSIGLLVIAPETLSVLPLEHETVAFQREPELPTKMLILLLMEIRGVAASLGVSASAATVLVHIDSLLRVRDHPDCFCETILPTRIAEERDVV